jgi:hypothetical protein
MRLLLDNSSSCLRIWVIFERASELETHPLFLKFLQDFDFRWNVQSFGRQFDLGTAYFARIRCRNVIGERANSGQLDDMGMFSIKKGIDFHELALQVFLFLGQLNVHFCPPQVTRSIRQQKRFTSCIGPLCL